MKNIIAALVCCCALGCELVLAQEAVVPAGGEASSSAGTVSYTVGQVFYHTYSANEYEVAEGVQHGYEVFPVSVEESLTRFPEVSIFPNPTANEVLVRSQESAPLPMQWRLINVQGTKVGQGVFPDGAGKLAMSELPSGIYFLELQGQYFEAKTFKIIKTTLP